LASFRSRLILHSWPLVGGSQDGNENRNARRPSGERRPYTAHVVEEAQVWALDKSDLDALLSRYPAVGVAVRQELARHFRSPSKAVEAKSQYNPIITVGGDGWELARHLAEQTNGKVALIDLAGRRASIRDYVENNITNWPGTGGVFVMNVKERSW